MNTKSMFESKTFWFGAGQILFGIIGLLTSWIDHNTSLTLIMTGMGTIGFRSATSTPIAGFIPKR